MDGLANTFAVECFSVMSVFIQSPQDIKAVVSIMCVISVVESITNLLKVRFWKLFCHEDEF